MEVAKSIEFMKLVVLELLPPKCFNGIINLFNVFDYPCITLNGTEGALAYA